MANPELIVCDSDVLAQLFLINQVRTLQHLKDEFGIQPAVVEEVNIEIRWLQNYRDRFVFQIDRALKSGMIVLLDKSRFQTYLGTAPVGASWESFQRLGQQYDGRVHRGEAYSFAASVTLNVPALSNDYSAIRTLQCNMLSLPSPVLRTFDLIAFCYQTGCLSAKDCNTLRSQLMGAHEPIPRSFQNASFEDGLNGFTPRLVEGDNDSSSAENAHTRMLYVTRK